MQLGFSKATVEYIPTCALWTPDDNEERIMQHLCFSATNCNSTTVDYVLAAMWITDNSTYASILVQQRNCGLLVVRCLSAPSLSLFI